MNETLQRSGLAVLALSTIALCGGCALDVEEPAPEDLGQTEHAAIEQNGASLNGASLNGASLNGASLNGASLNGASLNGASLNGVSLSGSNLTSKTKKGNHLLSGSELIGAEFTTKLKDGRKVKIRIDDVEKQATKYWKDYIYQYTVAYTLPEETDAWAYVCGIRDGVPLKAIPLKGSWNHQEGVEGGGAKSNESGAITFACEGYALYKCVEIGYEPWIGVGNNDKYSLSDHHQACTRMIRADYCGDGQPWTVDGTLVNVYDLFGIQKDSEKWDIEAEWDEDGARCLSHQRIQNMAKVPQCSFPKSSMQCGKNVKWNKTLLVSEAL